MPAVDMLEVVAFLSNIFLAIFLFFIVKIVMQGSGYKFIKKMQKLYITNNNWAIDQLTGKKSKCISFRFFICKNYNI